MCNEEEGGREIKGQIGRAAAIRLFVRIRAALSVILLHLICVLKEEEPRDDGTSVGGGEWASRDEGTDRGSDHEKDRKAAKSIRSWSLRKKNGQTKMGDKGEEERGAVVI